MATDTRFSGCVLDQGHHLLVGVVLVEASCSCAVTFRGSEYGLPLESVSVTKMCVGCSTVADVRPGPLTWQV